MRRGKKQKIGSVIVLLVFLAALAWRGTMEREEGRLPEKVPVDGGEDWEWWTECMVTYTEEEPFAFAAALVSDTEAELSWGFYEDRDMLLAAFSEEKARVLKAGKAECLPWFFIKIPVDDIHALDIYEYLQQNLADEGYEYEAWTMDEGKAFEIIQQWEQEEGKLSGKREVIIRDGYLYLLECEKVNAENREEVDRSIYWLRDELVPYNSGWGMDEETLYWVDHRERVQTFQNPDREFTEERAVDKIWRQEQIMCFFALMSRAEYRVRLAPELPELTITFQFPEEIPEDGYETYLWNGQVMDEPYQMEVRTAEDDRLLQAEEVNLNIDYIDTIFFEDLDEDGYLDMRISYLTYFSGYDGRDVLYERYWLWNVSEEKFEKESEEAVWQRRNENRAHLQEEEPAETSAKTYTVQRGDSLWRIAERYYGDGERWIEIYRKNMERIGGNPSLIFEGMELTL